MTNKIIYDKYVRLHYYILIKLNQNNKYTYFYLYDTFCNVFQAEVKYIF